MDIWLFIFWVAVILGTAIATAVTVLIIVSIARYIKDPQAHKRAKVENHYHSSSTQ